MPIEVQRLIADMAAHNHTWSEERIAAELRVKRGLTMSPRTVRRDMPLAPGGRGGRDDVRIGFGPFRIIGRHR
jgi:hypothetical protein